MKSIASEIERRGKEQRENYLYIVAFFLLPAHEPSASGVNIDFNENETKKSFIL